ncbi:carbohydrate ABC transporter permease [Neobacillus jeddahensis]|uniref:carbohydrate ABC transporter permease n=1 Tax=Neobacillus jeddahensis TaxID=1461580 RepID=UPI000A6E46F6|nr:sugar ABC transporter permease [Neobacillus jeddahensis]
MNQKYILKRNDRKTAYIMLLPIVLLLTCFVVIPLIYAIFVSFYEWSFYKESIFVGLTNFKRVLKDHLFYKAIWTGVKFALIVVPTQFVLAFLFANLIKSLGGKLSGFIKSAIYIPYVISGVVASIIFIFIYDFDGGIANYIIGLFGLEKTAWLIDVKVVLGAISVPAIWLGFGFTTLIMLSGLNDIPSSYYEAAEIDGANGFQKMWYITIPLLRNIFMYVIVVGITGAIQQFDLPFIMTKGGPLNSTMTPNLFIYNHFINDPYLGYTIASALLLFVLIGALAGIVFKLGNSTKSMDS